MIKILWVENMHNMLLKNTNNKFHDKEGEKKELGL